MRICVFSLNKLCLKQSLLRSSCKKVRRLEKSTPTPLQALLTIIRYESLIIQHQVKRFASKLLTSKNDIRPNWQCGLLSKLHDDPDSKSIGGWGRCYLNLPLRRVGRKCCVVPTRHHRETPPRELSGRPKAGKAGRTHSHTPVFRKGARAEKYFRSNLNSQ